MEYDEELCDVIIVDNGSASEERAILMDYARHNQFIVLTGKDIDVDSIRAPGSGELGKYMVLLDRNDGYAVGNNVGLRLASVLGYEYVLIVNNDVIFEQPVLECLKHAIEKYGNIAVVGPRIVSESDISQGPFGKPGFLDSVLLPFFYPFSLALSKIMAKSPRVGKNESQILIVYRVMGCCMLVKTDAIKVAGYFDEHTFLYAEEDILSERLLKSGYQVAFVPGATVRHLHAESTKSQPKITLFSTQLKSDIYYFRTYRKFNTIFILLFVIAQSMMFFIWAPVVRRLRALCH
jgi:GT2 family glycosyltransferase